MTYALALGESAKNVDDLLATVRHPSRSDGARDLVLALLEDEGDQESDAFEARVARETGLAAKTVKNLRHELGREGLIKSYPRKDNSGVIERWMVGRTAAAR